MVQFAEPWFLLLTPLAPLVSWWWLRRRRPALRFSLADGMRFVVLAALLACGLSGFALLGLHAPAAPPTWLALMGLKAAVWAVAFALFAYISWVFWPRRVFAAEPEYPGVRRQGLALALVMIALAGLGLLLGQAAQGLR